MRHIREFSRFAKSYGQYNIIQREVAKELAGSIIEKPQCIIDLGCGSGTFYDTIDWEVKRYIAVDLSDKMLELHPKADNIEFLHADFDDPGLFEQLKAKPCHRLVSSSSLQWSRDLKTLLARIQKLHIPFSLAIFSSGTFQTVHETAGLHSPLPSTREITELAREILGVEAEVRQYTLQFDSKRELFSYIKKSGVSGAKRQLNYAQTKKLIASYPLDYLEFEVVFITS